MTRYYVGDFSSILVELWKLALGEEVGTPNL